MTAEFDHEPIRGLPGHLPEGERILWQGAPSWGQLALHGYPMAWIAGYLGGFMLIVIGAAALNGSGVVAGLRDAVWLVPAGLVGAAILGVIAFAAARSTVYTITNRRVVMRYGIAVEKAINIPFAIIESAALRELADGKGDIALSLSGSDSIAYLHLWPHARPWRFAKTEPMLRAVPNAKQVAALLGEALCAALAERRRDGLAAPGVIAATGPTQAAPPAVSPVIA